MGVFMNPCTPVEEVVYFCDNLSYSNLFCCEIGT